jgi:hypothetical protein
MKIARPSRSHFAVEAMSSRNVELSRVRPELVRDDDALFLLVTSASFIESGSDTYTSNLLERFDDDEEVGQWLRERWEPEELQHGRMLKAYVQRVWPELDWDGAYASFFEEYSKICTLQELEPTRGQEMAARCVVEMGTTAYYQALHDACSEPALRELTWRIRGDEVQHYKHFYAYFLKYRMSERLSRHRVLASLVRRALELRSEDATIALRHAARWRRLSCRGSESCAPIDEMTRQAYQVVSRHMPMDLAARMLLKPLRLQPRLQRAFVPPLARLGRSVLLR